jgi:hypothetical protein
MKVSFSTISPDFFTTSVKQTGITRTERNKARKAKKLKLVGCLFDAKCANSSCTNVVQYLYMNGGSKNEALRVAGWRCFRKFKIDYLCPYCADIQDQRNSDLRAFLYRKAVRRVKEVKARYDNTLA